MENLTRREREKKVREQEIIAAAKKVFSQKGFEEASMDEIASEAQFTKRTLYQYFADKEDLYFAVIFKGFKTLSEYLQEAAEGQENGFMKLYHSSMGYYRFYKEYPEMLRLMNYLGHVKRKSKEGSERRKEFIEFNNSIFMGVAKLIEEGKADGSIRKDLDSVKTAFSMVFMMTGFFNQISTSGEDFMANFALEREGFILFNMDLLFGSLKSNR